MALVQVKEVFRTGLIQKVTRFVSPPNPSGASSFLWKSDSFSRQKRTLMIGRMMEYRTSFFSITTQIVSPGAEAELHTSSAAQMAAEEKSSVTSAGTSSGETDTGILDRSYGEKQGDHHKVAEDTHEHYQATKDDEEPESLEATGFDISKATTPSGGE